MRLCRVNDNIRPNIDPCPASDHTADNRSAKDNLSPRQIVFQCICRTDAVMFYRRRTVIDLARSCRIKRHGNARIRMVRIRVGGVIRRDMQRTNPSLRIPHRIVFRVVNTIVSCRCITRGTVNQCGVQSRVADRLIRYLTACITAYIRTGPPCIVEILPADFRERSRVKRQRVSRENPMEYDVSRDQSRDIRRAVVRFVLAPDINRQLLFINIRRTPVHIRRTQRIVRERGRITARKRQRIVNGASRRVCGCERIFTRLCRGILGAVRSRDCQMNLVGIPRNDARQLLICHRIDEVFVVLIERPLPVILLNEMCRELRRKVARRDRARRMAHIITRPRKIEVRRIDADTVVDLVRSNNIGAIVRRRQELNVR